MNWTRPVTWLLLVLIRLEFQLPWSIGGKKALVGLVVSWVSRIHESYGAHSTSDERLCIVEESLIAFKTKRYRSKVRDDFLIRAGFLFVAVAVVFIK